MRLLLTYWPFEHESATRTLEEKNLLARDFPVATRDILTTKLEFPSIPAGRPLQGLY
jgi:hypothetical protein